jgi:N-acetylneuraminic acid mutarotase
LGPQALPSAATNGPGGGGFDLSPSNSLFRFTQAAAGGPAATNYLVWERRSTADRGFWSMNGTIYLEDWIPLRAAESPWTIAAVADFTGDQKSDILWQNLVTGEVGFWRMDGMTFGQWIPFVTLALKWQIAGAADMTGDGKTDIIWQDTESGDRGLWVMNRTNWTGQWLPLYPLTVPIRWDIAAVKDMTGDGNPDLVWQDTQNGDRGIWPYNNTTYTHEWIPIQSRAIEWDIAGATDMNNDGYNDLLWEDLLTGERGTWLFNKEVWSGRSIPIQTKPVEWRLAGGRVSEIGTWVTKAAMPAARSSPWSAVVNDVVYIFALNTIDKYTPATNQWVAGVGTPLSSRTQAGGAAVNGLIYSIGGQNVGQSLSGMETYNPATGVRAVAPAMATGRSRIGVGVIGGIIYVVGGYVPETTSNLATVVAYDPATSTWSTKASMPAAQRDMMVAVVNGILYAIGGYPNQTAVRAYDPVSNSWTTKASMPSPGRGQMGGVGVINGIIYVAGGFDHNFPGTTFNSVVAYDPALDSWSAMRPMPTPRSTFAGVAVGGSFYVMGGYGPGTVLTLAVEAFQP